MGFHTQEDAERAAALATLAGYAVVSLGRVPERS